jgi:hypothetical protein
MSEASDTGTDFRVLNLKLEAGNTRRLASATAPCIAVTASFARR